MKKKNIYQMNENELGSLDNNVLVHQLRNMKVKNAGLSARVSEKQKSLSQMMTRKGAGGKDTASSIYAGNIGDLSKIIWPFFFQSEVTTLIPNTVETANISITQEAAFVITKISASVFELIEQAEVLATAASETLTFEDNNLNDHVLDFNDAKIIIGTDVVIGANLSDTIDAIIAYMVITAPFKDIYTFANIGGTQLEVTTIETGESANLNNEFVYVYPAATVSKVKSTGFIGGADTIAATTTVEYVDLNKNDDDGLLEDLKLVIVDSQSSRSWHDEPVPVTMYGDGRNPFVLDKPYMILQDQNLEIRWTNNGTKTYIASLLLHGYRIRISDSEGIMSLVTA